MATSRKTNEEWLKSLSDDDLAELVSNRMIAACLRDIAAEKLTSDPRDIAILNQAAKRIERHKDDEVWMRVNQ